MMKKILLSMAPLFAFFMFTNAQNSSPYWSLAGNSNATSSSKLGTTNANSLRFYTNNVQRMIINSTAGLVGIGTTSPTDKLHINSPSGTNALRVQVNGSTKLLVHSGGGVSVGSSTTPPANGLYVLGRVGIGTSTPLSKLHINASGTDAYQGLGITSTLTGGKTLTINQGTPGKLNFTEPGILDLMTMDFTTGNVGIGTTNPGKYKLKISYNNAQSTPGQAGLDIENTYITNNGVASDWEIYTMPFDNFDNVAGNLAFFANGTLKSEIDGLSGAYYQPSDERLKTNIKLMTAMLDKINQLEPSTYQFKNATNKQEYNGFIAQDVMKIFPDLVMHNVDPSRKLEVYSMNYSGFGVLAIKGIQELAPIVEQQKKINEEQKVEIITLKERIDKLEELVSNLTGRMVKTTNQSLEQNKPNPFSKNTTIRYSIPQGSKGQINIYDQTGKLVKSLNANESGQSELSGHDLSSGTYTYTLIVDGKIALSKQMLIVK